MTRKSCLAEQILVHARSKIADGGWLRGGLVPPIAWLAREWKTSVVTAQKVVKALAAEGLIVKRPGKKRYYLKSAHDAVSSQNLTVRDPRPRHERIAADLRSEMLSGSAAGGSIDLTFKRIRKAFRCDYKTALKALQILEQERLVTRRENRYHTLLPTAMRGTGTRVALVGPDHYLITDPMLTRFTQGIERVLMEYGWRDLRYILPSQYASSTKSGNIPGHQVAGFIVVPHPSYHGFLRSQIIGQNAPCIMLDRDGDLHKNELFAGTVAVGPDHEKAGENVGRYVAGLGHEHIAFITHVSSSISWVSMRLRALRRIFPFDLTEAKSGMKVFSMPEGTSRPFRGLGKKIRSDLREGEFSEALRAYLPLQYLHTQLVVPSWRIEEMLSLAARMKEVFQAALRDERISCWVCVNDEMGILALNFLKRNGIPAPKRIAVIGFDNHPISLMAGLTTYDFRYDSLGALAVNALAYPLSSRTAKGLKTAEGLLVERRST